MAGSHGDKQRAAPPQAPEPASAPEPTSTGARAQLNGDGYQTGSEDEASLHESLARAGLRAEREPTRERTFALTERALIDELHEEIERERPRAARPRQLGIRLGQRQWERIELVAAWSGVPMTTMARVLINRGAKAVIDDELRQRRRYGPEGD